MKFNFLLIFIFSAQLLSAQVFTEVLGTPFVGINAGSIAFSDVDGDGDMDVLITGSDNSSNRFSRLYTNDGAGVFTEVSNTPFDDVALSSVAFSDVDGDGDMDVLITGSNNTVTKIAKLYINDGAGAFTEVTGTPFEGVSSSSVDFADVDGDGDMDVLIIGVSNSVNLIARLYTNDGTGVFTEVAGTPFEGKHSGSVDFADVDGDGDMDVLITGKGVSFNYAKLYTNDGAGIFTEMAGTPFGNLYNGSVAFSDVDGDGDMDVLLAGQNMQFSSKTKLYTNNGAGVFTEALNTPFARVDYSSVAFSDVDNDGDTDVLITGGGGYNYPTGNEISRLYTNNGAGVFTELTNTPFDGVDFSSIAFSDVNNDGNVDVLITGATNTANHIAKLYTNDGMVSSVDDESKFLDFEFALYPNPIGTDLINVKIISEDNSSLSISVFDIEGKLLGQQQKRLGVGTNAFLLDISFLSKGSYILQIDNGIKKGVRNLLIH